MTIKTPSGGSTCRSTPQDGMLVERMYDHITLCRYFENRVLGMEVVKEFSSGPHKQ